jgi:hypothetical protein
MVPAADPGEGGQPVLELEPVVSQPALEHHRRAAMAGAAQEQPSPADVEPARVAASGHDHRWGGVQTEELDPRWGTSGDPDRHHASLARGALDESQSLAGPRWIDEPDEAEGPELGHIAAEDLDDFLRRRRHGKEPAREVLPDLGLGEGESVPGELGQHPVELAAKGAGGQERLGAGLDAVGVDPFAVVGPVVPGGGAGGRRGAGGDGCRQQDPDQQENHELASAHPDHLRRLVTAVGCLCGPGRRTGHGCSFLAWAGSSAAPS